VASNSRSALKFSLVIGVGSSVVEGGRRCAADWVMRVISRRVDASMFRAYWCFVSMRWSSLKAQCTVSGFIIAM